MAFAFHHGANADALLHVCNKDRNRGRDTEIQRGSDKETGRERRGERESE